MRPELKKLKLIMDKAKAYYYSKEIQETDDAAIHYKAYMEYVAARTAFSEEYKGLTFP